MKSGDTVDSGQCLLSGAYSVATVGVMDPARGGGFFRHHCHQLSSSTLSLPQAQGQVCVCVCVGNCMALLWGSARFCSKTLSDKDGGGLRQEMLWVAVPALSGTWAGRLPLGHLWLLQGYGCSLAFLH